MNVEKKLKKAKELEGKVYNIITPQNDTVSVDEENHTAKFILSTGKVDRHGDIVDQDSWILEHFKKNAPFLFHHESNDFPLGKWNKIWFEDDPELGKILVGEAEFGVDIYDKAKLAFDMVKKGYIKMVSVGFIPHEVDYDEEKDVFILSENELLEGSLVNIGSNRDALLKSDDPVEKLIDAKKDINKVIKKKHNTKKAVAFMKARDTLNKTIRRLKNNK